MVNAAMNEVLFLAIANHSLTVVGADGSYTKPLTKDYVVISPGQTLDCLLESNHVPPQGRYYMSARAYSTGALIPFDNTTTTGILQYDSRSHTTTTRPIRPSLPYYNDSTAAFNFIGSLKSLHPSPLPLRVHAIDTQIFTTLSVNTFPCPNNSCEGPRVHEFPSVPPLYFNFTGNNIPLILETPKRATEVRVVEYNSMVEVVFQGTNLVSGLDHPMHLHGFNFYVVGWGYGNFDKEKDPLNYNLASQPSLPQHCSCSDKWTGYNQVQSF
nr:laccase/diphenol oxidase family protein [Tanacetum cinerariifolium]